MENELKQHSNDCFVADSKGLNITQSKHDKRACTKCGEIKTSFLTSIKKVLIDGIANVRSAFWQGRKA